MRNCEIGARCGSTCIEKKDECRVKNSSGTAKIANKMTGIVKTVITEATLKHGRGGSITLDWKVGKHKVQITSNNMGSYRNVNFSVNGSYSKDEKKLKKMTEPEKRAVSKSVLTNMKKLFKSIIDDTTVVVSATDSDDAGDKRKRLYEKFGFSPADEEGYQYGVVYEGKVTPISRPYSFDNEDSDDEDYFSEAPVETATDEEIIELLMDII